MPMDICLAILRTTQSQVEPCAYSLVFRMLRIEQYIMQYSNKWIVYDTCILKMTT